MTTPAFVSFLACVSVFGALVMTATTEFEEQKKVFIDQCISDGKKAYQCENEWLHGDCFPDAGIEPK